MEGAGKGKGVANAASLPRLEVDQASLTVVDALVQLEFAKSKGEAKRLIKGGGARLDDVKVADVDAAIALAPGVDVKVSSGKKKHAILALKSP